jgi:hypothetical protein
MSAVSYLTSNAWSRSPYRVPDVALSGKEYQYIDARIIPIAFLRRRPRTASCLPWLKLIEADRLRLQSAPTASHVYGRREDGPRYVRPARTSARRTCAASV